MGLQRLRQQPRYMTVAAALRQAIAEGRHPVGSTLPTETKLCADFEVSRHTVREALRRLAELGLVTRRQGSGTQVVADHPVSAYTQSLASIDDLLQYAAATELTLGQGRTVRADRDLAGQLECAVGRRWRCFSGVRHRRDDGRPICLTDVYLDPVLADVEAELDRGTGAIYQLVERHSGEAVSEVRQDITAVTLSGDEAERLDATPGAPALHIVRRYVGTSGRIFEVSISTHPADRFAYAMRIRREAVG